MLLNINLKKSLNFFEEKRLPLVCPKMIRVTKIYKLLDILLIVEVWCMGYIYLYRYI